MANSCSAPLVSALLPDLMNPIRQQEADRGKTVKTLWKLSDVLLVQSVLMRYKDRATICISSQAGCGMACPFCATGQGGLQRNMSTAEIVHQVIVGARAMANGEVAGGPDACPTWSSWAWESRSPTTRRP